MAANEAMRRYARELVAKWPPLTTAQRAQLAILLRPKRVAPAKAPAIEREAA